MLATGPLSPPHRRASRTDAMSNSTISTSTELRTPWAATDYHFQSYAKRGSNWKLGDSGVAPLVAQARGYDAVVDKDSAKTFSLKQRAGEGRVKTQTTLINLLHNGDDDVLVMPYYSPGSVIQDGTSARPVDHQYRPSTPSTDAMGKSLKYTWLPGATMSLDIHPSTPASWITSARSVLLIEGLLKADSVLTAQLVEVHGADALGYVQTRAQALTRLLDLLEAIPRQFQILVVAASSVTTWHKPDQWREFDLKGRRALVAFDGDLTTNPMVWKETVKAREHLWRATGNEAALIQLWGGPIEAAKLSAGFKADDRIGMDDYLTRLGSLEDALDLVTVMMPPEPERIVGYKNGDWRVHPQCPAVVEELVQSPTGGAHWEIRTRIGMEILEVRSTRRPTPGELRTGEIDSMAEVPSTEEAVVRFHVLGLYQEPGEDRPESFDVRMPASALAATSLGDWNRLLGTGVMRLPAGVLAHPDFNGLDMRKWFRAVKTYSRYELTQGWEQMNWLPTGSGGAFLVGSTVIAATAEEEQSTICGISVRDMSNVKSWGVSDNFRNMDYRAWQGALVQDLRRALNVWFGSFENLGMASVLWGTMIQPTYLKRHDGTVVVISGSQGRGKSLCASFVMQGWAAKPGVWTHKSLPGTASDTLPATEIALSRTPIHVMDDLAPDSDQNVSAARVSSVERIARGVFNGTTRSRMGERVPDAIAQLFITAENASHIPSIASRVWEINLNDAFLVEKGRASLDEASRDGLWSRITGYAARSWVSGSLAKSAPNWTDRVLLAEGIIDDTAERVRARAEQVLGTTDIGFAGRQIEKLVAIYAPLAALAREYGDILGALGEDMKTDKYWLLLNDAVFEALVERALAAATQQAHNTPGRLALKAIALLLTAGKAHLTNPVEPAHPPVGSDHEKIAAGWQYVRDSWIPRGPSIGSVGVSTTEGRLAVLKADNAFKEAARSYPELIIPGSTARAAWASLEGELGLVPGGVPDPKGRPRLRPGTADDAQKEETDAKHTTADNRVSGLSIYWAGLTSLID